MLSSRNTVLVHPKDRPQTVRDELDIMTRSGKPTSSQTKIKSYDNSWKSTPCRPSLRSWFCNEKSATSRRCLEQSRSRNENGFVARRLASINHLPIRESDRRYS